MLVLRRKPGERIFLQLPGGEWIAVTVQDVQASGVGVGFQAPHTVYIMREENLTEQQRDEAIASIREYEGARR